MSLIQPPPPVHESLLADLKATLASTAVRTAEQIDLSSQTDWSGEPAVCPLALVSPRSTQEVQAVLRICHAHRTPVVAQGGMTGLAGGAVPTADSVALSLAGLQQIENIDAQAGVLLVQAGVSLERAQQAASDAGWTLGLDFGARGSCHVGGAVATNAGGNNVIQYDMAREQVLGLEVVLADGRVLCMLDPMQKNNAGYDLKHWFIGSEGTLGIITRVLLRLHPQSPNKATALLALPAFDAAPHLLRHLRKAFSGHLCAFELMWQDFLKVAFAWRGGLSLLTPLPPLAALIQVSGPDEAVLQSQLQTALAQAMEEGWVDDAVLAQSLEQAKSLWSWREITAEFGSRMDPINFDVSLPLHSMAAFAEQCEQQLHARWPGTTVLRFGHLGDGNLHLTVDAASLPVDGRSAAHEWVQDCVYGLVRAYSGSVSAEHGIGTHKKGYLLHSRSEHQVQAMRAIKAALDPLGLLNPGKVFDLHPRSLASQMPD